MKLIVQFLKEAYRWVRHGHRYRDKELMKEIYNTCTECPNFNKNGSWMEGYDSCGICGCNLHPTKRALNKIAWSTTSCPDDPPRWDSEVEDCGFDPPF